MAKKKTSEELYKIARVTGENLGKLTVESKKQTKVLVRAGRHALTKAQEKTMKTAHETIPELISEFRKGLKKAMKQRR